MEEEMTAIEAVRDWIKKAELQPGMKLSKLQVAPRMYRLLEEQCGMDPSTFFRVEIVADPNMEEH